MNNEEIKASLRNLSSQASQKSKEAVFALKAGNFELGRNLIKEAVKAGKNCQDLIAQNQKQLQKSSE